jgi:hypothetical protein
MTTWRITNVAAVRVTFILTFLHTYLLQVI